MFDDSLLDDPVGDHPMATKLEWLARAGARLRMESSDDLAQVTAALAEAGARRPRAVLVVGTEARLVRAVLEPVCPVPVVVWSGPQLPHWTGALDLVVVLAGGSTQWLPTCQEASRRGSLLLVVVPSGSPMLDRPWPSPAYITHADDSFVAGIVALSILGALGLGPRVDDALIADALDEVAQICGPRYGLGLNPAKELACALADRVPLLCGASPLAGRASRRVAEALREANGMPALAADASALTPLMTAAQPRDVFADPFDSVSTAPAFTVVILDDGDLPASADHLARLAESRHQRVERIIYDHGGPLERYSRLRHHGLFAAAYLGMATREGR